MSAPPPDSPPSISSSGHSDGLGRRVIVFDREDGAMLEALHVRPEIGAFETALRDRIERLAAFEDERFARIRGVDRDPDTGELVVVSEFVPGTRLSDLLDVAQESAQEGITPGVDVALGYLLEALPAVSALHAATGVAHGAIAPARTVLTPAGQVVFLDTAFGEILERLSFSRKRLWNEFGLAMPPSAGRSRFDVPADIGQVALNAVMLVLGRPLGEFEYPDALPSLMMEVVEVAQIRGTPNFAGAIQRFLQRALPLPGRRVYANADEATIDIRQVARQEIGLPVCRRALIDFIAETAEGLAALKSRPATAAPPEPAIVEPALISDLLPEGGSHVDLGAVTLDVLEDEADLVCEPAEEAADTEAEDVPLEHEIVLETDEPEATYEISVPAEALVGEFVEDFAKALADQAPTEEMPARDEPAEPFVHEPVVAEPLVAEPFVPEPAVAEPVVAEPLVAEPVVAEPVVAEPVVAEPVVAEPVVAEPLVAEPFVAEPSSPESFRRKRLHSVRARKDKLRSSATAGHGGAVASQPRVSPPPLVSPDRAAAYDPAFDDYSPATRAIGFAPPPPSATPSSAAPPQPAFVPAALAPPTNPIPMPQFPAPPASSPHAGQSTTIWSAPPIESEPAAAAVKPVPIQAPKPLSLVPPAPPAPTAAAPIKLKDTGTSFGAQTARVEPRIPRPDSERYVALPHAEHAAPEETRGFPWKLAAAAIIIVAAGIGAGRWYLPNRQADGATETSAAATAPATPSKAVSGPDSASAIAGHVDIQTQPAGAHVLLDGQAVGETPLKIDVMPGRHVLTFVSASGSVKRNVRVDAGKSISVDVPLFSGWIAIFAPVVLEIAENGKAIGSTEDGRIMLAPGRHELTLSNKDLGYVGKQTVDIEPGELNSLSVEPRGGVNFNAIPWAEVWIDGTKAGETPLANAQVTLGVREIVFKNPEFGERRMVTTVRADSVAAVSVDFTKQ